MFEFRQRRERPQPQIPLEIYSSLVDSLYSEERTLLVGSTAVFIATLISAWKTFEPLLFAVAVAVGIIAVARVWDIRNYHRQREAMSTQDNVRRWERRYVIGAAASVALLGGWCFISFVEVRDPFVNVFSMSVTIAYMIGITGRNFGSQRLVFVQILAACLPITAALLLVGDTYYSIFAFVLFAFFMSMKQISDRLRRTLLDAVIANRDMALLAKRFDTALNNMPHGLCMFDSERRLVVTNQRLLELLGLQAQDRKGTTASELVRECVAVGTVLRSAGDQLTEDFENRLAAGRSDSFNIDKQDGRTLNLTFQPMDNGGSVVLIEDVTERRAAEARINHLARYDALTGLPNRMFMREQMEKALTAAGKRPCAVLFVDLDQFKQVNDTLGHPRGDILLRAVADRLRRLIRNTDIVARFGGDEFVVLQTPIADDGEAAKLAQRIITSLSQTYEVDGHQVVIGASIGIAMSPRDAAGVDHLLKNADMALYWAKADQRGTWRYFEPEMDVRAHARRSLELDLRHALTNNAFQVYYQPLFDLRTKRISTCEALLRWPHPTRGMISPGEFIPVAEEMGLIVELGNWVLREACRVCATWPNDVRVAVNLSANQFRRGDVAATIRESVKAAGLDASRLEIEITESVLFQDTRATRHTLAQIRDFGVRISLDDFGTGYSSLSYLHSLPLNKVKIDRSFLEGLELGDRSLVLLRGIAKLSADLGLSVAVEGIETVEQLTLISAEGNVSEAQGFLFSPAIPAKQIEILLNATPSRLELVA
jgi:diguanylate cyclase (GGDEF)-like protein/PAS domain S-box-containing protein